MSLILNNYFKKIKFTIISSGIFLSSYSVLAAELYDSSKNYVANDEVCLNGYTYRAKWWAGVDDNPEMVDTVSQPWETPWERIGESDYCQSSGLQLSINLEQASTDSLNIQLFAELEQYSNDDFTYLWQQVGGTGAEAEIITPEAVSTTIVLPPVDIDVEYDFKVTISSELESASKEITVFQTPVAGARSPVAVVSNDNITIVGAGAVALSAESSFDPEGQGLSFAWEQIEPLSPIAIIDNKNSVTPVVFLDEPHTDLIYVFEVQVSDGTNSDTAHVNITQRTEDNHDDTNDDTPVADQPLYDAWNEQNVYLAGDRVSYQGQNLEAQWWTKGNEPNLSSEPWGVWRAISDEDVETGEPGSGNSGSGDSGSSTPVEEPSLPDDGNASIVYRSELVAAEESLLNTPLMISVKESIVTLDNEQVEAVAPRLATNPQNVKRVESIVSEDDWDYYFPRRAPEYTYTNFLKAIAKFPAFCGDYSDGRNADAICRKALATMFSHFTQETGGHTIAWPEPQWRQGLFYVRELGWSEENPNGYGICDTSTWQGETWPCAKFPEGHINEGQYKSYFGRGSKQLSYNYNYGPFSDAIYGDVNVLLEQPNLVADTWLNLASAVFFYIYPQPPKPSMLHALDGTWVPNAHDKAGGLEPGFGVTTQIINGGVECGGTKEHAQSANRIEYYTAFADALNVAIAEDEILGCANMQRFDTQGAGALAIYWEQDWTTPNACQLVNYQTPFSAFKNGDYAKCVEYYFNVEIVEDYY